MPRTLRFLPFLGAILVLALAGGFALLPFSLNVQPSAAHAAPLAATAASFTGTTAVLPTVVFTDHTDLATDLVPATELQDGRILLIQGQEAGLYDLETGVLSTTGNLQLRHWDVQAISLPNGNALVVGGDCEWYEDWEFGNLYFRCDSSKAELYLTQTGTFTPSNASILRVGGQTMTLLPNGQVLVAGGDWPCQWNWEYTPDCFNLNSAGLYDPATDTYTSTDSMQEARAWHTATLLPNGKVLVVGGYSGSGKHFPPYFPEQAELYDPATGLFTPTGSLHYPRWRHTATLLPNGKVLIAGGTVGDYYGEPGGPKVAELYDPATGTFTDISDAHDVDSYRASLLLSTGDVLLLAFQRPELYDPATNTFRPATPYVVARDYRWITELGDGSVRVLATHNNNTLAVERGVVVPTSTFSGAMTLPSGWTNSRTVPVSFSGSSSNSALEAGAPTRSTPSLPNEWIPLTNGETVTTTYTFTQDGTFPLWLRLRDNYQRTAIVVTGTVQIDTVLPQSTMQALPATVGSTEINLQWSGSDARSGLANYDVEVRAGNPEMWTPLLSATTATQTTFTGEHGTTYYFRARARDVAGNVEVWPSSYDTYTLVDTVAPTGSATINAGAHATTARQVTLYLPASDALNTVPQMRLSNDGTTWGAWQSRTTPFNYTLPAGDGLKTVYVQYRDAAGNLSSVVSDAIRLDEAAGSDELVTINNGALWTNSTTVTLTISAPERTGTMQLSNDGGFAGASWQLFDTRPNWNLVPYGSYAIPRTVYVRVKNINGTQSTVYQDDIIYDPVPPTGTLGIQSVTSTSVNVNLNASDPDNLSGVAAMRVALTSNLSQVAWQPYATSRTLPRNGTSSENLRAYAQFRDGAGNVSNVICAAASGSCTSGGPTSTPTRTPTPTATSTPLPPSARRAYSDFNGDGKSDILWRHTTTGENALYQMNGATIAQNLPINVAANTWDVAGVGDFNGDGKADILWRHRTSGLNYMYLMNGATIVRQQTVNTVSDLKWTIINHHYLMYGATTQSSSDTTSRVPWTAPPGEPDSAHLVVLPGDADVPAEVEPPGGPETGQPVRVPGETTTESPGDAPGAAETGQPVRVPGGESSHWLFLPIMERR